MATSELLGPLHTVDLPSGRLDYHERGSGPAVVFVHGLLVNADLWRNVVPGIADAGYRCLAPDWPLGAHRRPMPPSADLSPPGVAAFIAEFLDALDLTDVTVVANDTGGALTQILMTEHPERLGRIVLTPCDAFEDFFPPSLTPLRVVGSTTVGVWLLSRLSSIPAIQRSKAGLGMVAKHPLPQEILNSYTRPVHDVAGVRRDMRNFLRRVDKRHTLAAADKFADVKMPVLLVGAADERVFPERLAQKLEQLLPDARRVVVDDSYTFVPEDQPAELVRLVVDFLRSG
ncbi:MAG TPA: alpha/beta hydrolase [Pseudonocardiaceae bacterium]|nr:alpha/beta hydrolase [Pseudonocardiaceae bacterium]